MTRQRRKYDSTNHHLRNKPRGSKNLKSQRLGDLAGEQDDIDKRIRHHLEEASTHLGAVKELIDHEVEPIAHIDGLSTVGKFLKRLYVRHGGIDH
jgi:hypothetical protein